MGCPRIFKYAGIFILGLYTSYFLYEKPQIPSVKCEKGLKYKITEVGDLIKFIPDLECVFRAAVTPSKVPTGAMPGEFISFGNENIGIFRSLSASIWTGKYTSPPVSCSNAGRKIVLGWNWAVGRVLASPFEMFISPVKDVVKISHPSLQDNKPSLIIRYDLGQLELDCPNLKTEELRRSPFSKEFYPFHRIVDELRVVGRQKDGGVILLGKGLIRDVYDPAEASTPVAFFTIVSYDKGLNPEFKVGQSLSPLAQDTTHLHIERRDFYRALCPFDDLIKSPSRTVGVIIEEIKRISYNSFYTVPEIVWDLISPGEDSQTLRTAFEKLPIGLTDAEYLKKSQEDKPVKKEKVKEAIKDQPSSPKQTNNNKPKQSADSPKNVKK